VCLSREPAPFETIEDVRKQEMVIAGTGTGSDTNIWAIIINNLLGTKFKLVSGYPGTQETILAIERREAQGRIISLSALKTAKPDWLRDGKTKFLLQLALEKSSELPSVPLLIDLLVNEEDRQMISLLVGPTAMSRPFAAPPGLPAGIVALLRRAFDATMKDKEFLSEASRLQADVAPTSGEDVQKIVARMYATPRHVVERVKKYYVQ
jgi:tripartite-type tricarboxylate transporter receptor subunit TctC